MKQLKILLIGLLLISPIWSISQEVEKVNHGIKQFTLSNGLKVILDENHSQPEVFGLVIVKAGGKNDPSDATGMAHYQEHMLFKGTTTLGTISWERRNHISIKYLSSTMSWVKQRTRQNVPKSRKPLTRNRLRLQSMLFRTR